MSTSSAFDGKLYPPKKLQQLVKYLERRNVSVYGVVGDTNPRFVLFPDGKAQILLPENPTALQVKHELSHYLDYKKMGFDAYVGLSRAERESMVLQRLQQNRIWQQLNKQERQFSIDYVDKLNNLDRSFTK